MNRLFPARRFGKDILEQATEYARVIQQFPYSRESPLFTIASDLRAHLRSDTSSADTFQKAATYLEGIDKKLSLSSSSQTAQKETNKSSSPQPIVDPQTMKLQIKLFHASQYFKSLHQYSSNDADAARSLAKRLNIGRMVDAVLLGTASERLAEHISLLGNEYSEESLAVCLHTYCESEVATAARILQSFPAHKVCKKRVQKLAKEYLVDHLELNVKVRCVYAWSAPALGKDGFAPDFQDVMPLLYGRQEFFPESEKICALFIQEMSKTENMLDANREEWRGYQKKGSLFFVAVILLDWLVCSL